MNPAPHPHFKRQPHRPTCSASTRAAMNFTQVPPPQAPPHAQETAHAPPPPPPLCRDARSCSRMRALSSRVSSVRDISWPSSCCAAHTSAESALADASSCCAARALVGGAVANASTCCAVRTSAGSASADALSCCAARA
eukprot:364475-Chlamydomonas_euryale.AAC.10